jgi:hypothetical protein
LSSEAWEIRLSSVAGLRRTESWEEDTIDLSR